MNAPARSPLKPWRKFRAALMAFLALKLSGWSPLTDAWQRTALAVAAMTLIFLAALRFERWIQDQREAAERPSDPKDP
ncbi:MAG TPA: hypothetical protein VL426_00310 [Candidatus Binatia bacterium]|jgi:hypothetical protein|nr:hypothetical protein [Candidatus Binatia bacterium]